MGSTAKERVERTLQSLVLTDGEVESLKAKLLQLTEAKEIVRIGRDDNGIIYGEQPNLPVQLAATVKLLEFGIGKPRQAIEVTNNGAPPGAPRLTRADLARLLTEDPSAAHGLLTVMQAIAGLRPEMKQATPVEEVKSSEARRLPESESGASHSTDAKT